MSFQDRLSRLSPAQRAKLEASIAQRLKQSEAPSQEPEEAPLAYNQEALWLRDGLFPDNPTGNIYVAYLLEGPVDAAALQRSLSHLVTRHPMLRAVFGERDEQSAQWILPLVPLPFAEVDLRRESEATSPREAAEAFATEEASRYIPITEAPLFRARLGRLTPTRSVFTFCTHEIIADGRSFAVLLSELAALYLQECGGPKASLSALKESFLRFSRRQKQELSQELPRLQQEAVARFAKLPTRAPVTDFPRPMMPEFRGARVSLHLEAPLWSALCALGRSVKATPFMSAFSVLSLLVHLRFAVDSFAIPIAATGRNHPSEEDVIGLFLNMVPVITTLRPEDNATSFLSSVREACLSALRASALPYVELVGVVSPQTVSPNSLFPMIFAYQNMGSLALSLPGVRAERLSIDNGTCSYDMAWFAAEEDGGLSIEVKYDRDLFEERTIVGWLLDYQKLCQLLTEDPARKLLMLDVRPSGCVVTEPSAPFPPRPYVEPAGDEVLVQLREGSGAPLVLVASPSGYLGQFFSAVERLPEGLPCVALRVPEGHAKELPSIAAELLQRSPKAPYAFCAFGESAALAYEMARQATTPKLFLIDAPFFVSEEEQRRLLLRRALDLFGPLFTDLDGELLLEAALSLFSFDTSEEAQGLLRLLRIPMKLLGGLFGRRIEARIDAWDMDMAKIAARVVSSRLGLSLPALPKGAPTEEALLCWLVPFARWAGFLAPSEDEQALSKRLRRRRELLGALSLYEPGGFTGELVLIVQKNRRAIEVWSQALGGAFSLYTLEDSREETLAALLARLWAQR